MENIHICYGFVQMLMEQKTENIMQFCSTSIILLCNNNQEIQERVYMSNVIALMFFFYLGLYTVLSYNLLK